jgi:hypothetical protein
MGGVQLVGVIYRGRPCRYMVQTEQGQIFYTTHDVMSVSYVGPNPQLDYEGDAYI